MSSIRCTLTAFIILSVPALAVAQEARTFNLKLEEGKKFYSKTTTTVSQKMKVMGQELFQSQESTFFYVWTPIEQKSKPIDGTGSSIDLESGVEETRQVICEIEGVKMKIEISGNKIEYDSTVPRDDPGKSNPGLTEFLEKLVGAKFIVTVDRKNRVEKVDGVKEFLSKLAPTNSRMEDALKQIMSDDAVKSMCDPTFGLLPDCPKRPGETWTTTRTLQLGPIGSYTITYHSTYLGIANNMDIIRLVPQITYMAPNEKDNGSKLLKIKEGKLASDSTDKGIVLYDPQLHRIDAAKFSMTLKGDLTVTIGMNDTQVELMQTQKTTIKTSHHSLIHSKGDVEIPEIHFSAPILMCQPVPCCEASRHSCLRLHRIFGRRR
jgi:hypothetical protein